MSFGVPAQRWGGVRRGPGRPKGSVNKIRLKDNTKKFNRPPRLSYTDEVRLRVWFEEHPKSWEGWPSVRANAPLDRERRLFRLVSHGCPFLDRRNIVASADEIIGDIRNERRLGYTKRVHKEMGSTEKMAGYLVVERPGGKGV